MKEAARYLGIQATSPVSSQGTWSRASIACLRNGTGGRHLAKAEERARDLDQQGGSTGHRAHGWNAYVAPLVPYPAQTAGLPSQRAAWAEGLLRDLFRTGAWLPAMVLPGLGPLFGV